MALPKLQTPTYQLVLPSTNEKINYRPFLVKEQKILLIAQESKDDDDIAVAIGNLVSSCTFSKVDSLKSPLFDIEYIFLQIRAKSVGETAELLVTCPDDDKTKVPVKIKLNEISVQMTANHTNEINISENIKKLEPVLDTLSNLYDDAAEVDSDSASAISVAEDTVINAIKFLKASENESK